MTWVDRIIHSALRTQHRVAALVPASLKVAGANRKARLTITGESGNSYLMLWTGHEIIEEADPSDIRNDIVMHEQTLLDLVTGELSLRDGISARLIIIDGDTSLYDSEEIEQLFEKLINSIRKAVKEKT